VQRRKQSVFFIEIKPAGHIKLIFDDVAANKQVRELFDVFAGTTPQSDSGAQQKLVINIGILNVNALPLSPP